jgi:SAM-dependent methyltransferase
MINKEIQNIVRAARQTYSNEWFESSKAYLEKGFYKWCLNSIEGKHRVLEIGCGVGFSTIEIINANHVVVSIEENPSMLDFTEKNLKESNIEFKSVRRERFLSTENGYNIEYSSINDVIDQSHNTIIEGNILTDYNLRNWLVRNPPFDAVICWFMGVHGAIAKNDEIRSNLNLTEYEPMRYRQSVHGELCKIGDLILKQGGIFNFIDRTQYFENEEQRFKTLETFRGAFGELKTSIEICYIDQLEIADPSLIAGVSLKNTRNNRVVELVEPTRYALTTTIGIKK